MSLDVESLRVEYLAAEPALQEVRRDLESWLRNAVESLGLVDARVSGRVKNVHSFLTKCLLREKDGSAWTDPLSEASDKVGVRVDLVYLDQVDQLVDHITNATEAFALATKDDKVEALGDIELGYHGVHIDVIPRSVPNGLDADQCRCEIQIRTNAQAAWAMAVHPLQHKPPIELPPEMKRPLFRLTALLELFDEGVQNARDQMMGSEGYPLAILERSLDALRVRYTALPYQKELTRQMIVELDVGLSSAKTAHEIARMVVAFSEKHADKLRTIYAQHLESARPLLLVQPEAILLFYLLETSPMTTAKQWEKVDLPLRYLDDLADVWGSTLPAPI